MSTECLLIYIASSLSRDTTPPTMAMKVGHSEQTDQPTSNIPPSYITDIKSHYPQWKSIADIGQDEETPVWFSGVGLQKGTFLQMVSFFRH